MIVTIEQRFCLSRSRSSPRSTHPLDKQAAPATSLSWASSVTASRALSTRRRCPAAHCGRINDPIGETRGRARSCGLCRASAPTVAASGRRAWLCLGTDRGRRRNIFGTPRPRFRMDWDAARGRRLRGLQPFKLRRGFGRDVDDHTRNAGAVALLAAGGRTWRIAWVLDGSPLPATQSTAIHPRRASFDGRHTNGSRLARF